MAYVPANLSCGLELIGGKFRIWVYQSTDPFSTVDDTGYFDNASAAGMKEGDFVFVQDTDSDPPDVTLAYVSVINATTGVGTVAAVAFAGGASFTTLAASGATTLAALTTTGNTLLGDAAADLVGFYGGTGASQRASSVQVTTNIASSTDFGATQLAVVQEIMNTLTGLKLWKGAA